MDGGGGGGASAIAAFHSSNIHRQQRPAATHSSNPQQQTTAASTQQPAVVCDVTSKIYIPSTYTSHQEMQEDIHNHNRTHSSFTQQQFPDATPNKAATHSCSQQQPQPNNQQQFAMAPTRYTYHQHIHAINIYKNIYKSITAHTAALPGSNMCSSDPTLRDSRTHQYTSVHTRMF